MTNTTTIEALGVEELDQKSARDITGGFPWNILAEPIRLDGLIRVIESFIDGVREGYNSSPM
jgi:hypothetical protein